MAADGTELQLLHSGLVSHYDWRAESELLAWTDHDGEAFYRYDLDGAVAPVGRGVLPRDGHCPFPPTASGSSSTPIPTGTGSGDCTSITGTAAN